MLCLIQHLLPTYYNNWQFINLEIKMMRALETHITIMKQCMNACDYFFCSFLQHPQVFGRYWGCSWTCPVHEVQISHDNQARESSDLKGLFMSTSKIILCNLNICLSAVHLCSKYESELCFFLCPPSLIVIQIITGCCTVQGLTVPPVRNEWMDFRSGHVRQCLHSYVHVA